MSLSDKIIFTLKDAHTGVGKYSEEDLKNSISIIKDRIVENDIYTIDEIFRIINKEFGDRLVPKTDGGRT